MCTSLTAQEITAPAADQQVDKSKEAAPMKLSVKSYINWHTVLTESTDNKSGEKMNTFELERLYLQWEKDLGGIWSGRVTLDVGNEPVIENASLTSTTPTLANSSGTTVKAVTGGQTSKYRAYVKYAYAQAKDKIGDELEYKFQFGMIETPVIGFTDKAGDQRWVHKNLLDDSKSILGSSIDYSADMGASLALDYSKMINVTLALMNGEGYKNTNESLFNSSDQTKNTSQGKAVYGKLTVTPIEGLSLSGYYRQEGTSAKQSDNNKGYMGGGVAYKNDLLMAGVNYLLPFQKVDGEAVKNSDNKEKELSLADIWITVTPEKEIGLPLLVMARYGWGEDSNLEKSKVTFLGAGVGYVFNKNVRAMAWYQQYDSEAKKEAELPNPDKQFAVKAEINM
jgi:hypothetical protein